MHQVSLDDIRLINAIVDSGSFAGAAKALDVPRSHVTRRVKQVEAFLGVSLFSRSTRRLSLTPDGDTLLSHSKRIESEWLAAVSELSTASGTPRGRLRVCCYGHLSRILSRIALSDFVYKYPEITLDISSTWASPNAQSFEADLMLNISPLPDKSFVCEPLGTATTNYYASPAYLARCGVPASPLELPKFNLISSRFNEQVGWLWSEGEQVQQLKADCHLLFDDAESALNMALQGHGIVWGADFNFREHVSEGRMVKLFGGQHGVKMSLWAIYPRAPFLPQRLRLFIDMVKNSPLFKGYT